MWLVCWMSCFAKLIRSWNQRLLSRCQKYNFMRTSWCYDSFLNQEKLFLEKVYIGNLSSNIYWSRNALPNVIFSGSCLKIISFLSTGLFVNCCEMRQNMEDCNIYIGTSYQVFSDHRNRQKRRTLFESYLFEFEWVKYQSFYQAFEVNCWQTDWDQETTRNLSINPRATQNINWIVRSPLLPTTHVFVRIVFGDSPKIVW